MEAKNLRIGNIVNQDTEQGIGMVSGYQIYQLTVMENGGIYAKYLEEWSPIELTEKWLLNLGFESKTKSFTISKNRMNITIKKPRKGSFFYLSKKINYVHELQNLFFALTGRELELKQDISA